VQVNVCVLVHIYAYIYIYIGYEVVQGYLVKLPKSQCYTHSLKSASPKPALYSFCAISSIYKHKNICTRGYEVMQSYLMMCVSILVCVCLYTYTNIYKYMHMYIYVCIYVHKVQGDAKLLGGNSNSQCCTYSIQSSF